MAQDNSSSRVAQRRQKVGPPLEISQVFLQQPMGAPTLGPLSLHSTSNSKGQAMGNHRHEILCPGHPLAAPRTSSLGHFRKSPLWIWSLHLQESTRERGSVTAPSLPLVLRSLSPRFGQGTESPKCGFSWHVSLGSHLLAPHLHQAWPHPHLILATAGSDAGCQHW